MICVAFSWKQKKYHTENSPQFSTGVSVQLVSKTLPPWCVQGKGMLCSTICLLAVQCFQIYYWLTNQFCCDYSVVSVVFEAVACEVSAAKPKEPRQHMRISSFVAWILRQSTRLTRLRKQQTTVKAVQCKASSQKRAPTKYDTADLSWVIEWKMVNLQDFLRCQVIIF